MRDYKDFLKFKINEYSEEIGIPIQKTLWYKFENYFPLNNEKNCMNINFYTCRKEGKLSFYDFEKSYPIPSIHEYKLAIRHTDYLTYLRINKIDSLFN